MSKKKRIPSERRGASFTNLTCSSLELLIQLCQQGSPPHNAVNAFDDEHYSLICSGLLILFPNLSSVMNVSPKLALPKLFFK